MTGADERWECTDMDSARMWHRDGPCSPEKHQRAGEREPQPAARCGNCGVALDITNVWLRPDGSAWCVACGHREERPDPQPRSADVDTDRGGQRCTHGPMCLWCKPVGPEHHVGRRSADVDTADYRRRLNDDQLGVNDVDDLIDALDAARARADAAEQRIELARRALVASGYFTAEQVGTDIAPRIVELRCGLTDELRDLESAALARVRALCAATDEVWASTPTTYGPATIQTRLIRAALDGEPAACRADANSPQTLTGGHAPTEPAPAPDPTP